jgi:hypothetical protein
VAWLNLVGRTVASGLAVHLARRSDLRMMETSEDKLMFDMILVGMSGEVCSLISGVINARCKSDGVREFG